ncbi:MAG: ATP-binding protein, partial [Planctomycetota bacterium]
MKFSSEQFYDGKLQSHSTVANHRLSDIYEMDSKSDLNSALTFIDTAGANWHEEQESDGESRFNPQEAEFLIEQIRSATEAGVYEKDIAVIAPYSAQVRFIREQADSKLGSVHQVEIDTVDGYQGREKEIVMISLVRSNEKCEIGFLADQRRMNVALTRARRRLLIVGDSATIGGHAFYERMLKYFETQDAYKSIWEFLY